jgi:hypothetical protein
VQQRLAWSIAALSTCLLIFLSGCGTPSQAGQQTQQAKAQLDAELARAQRMGVPSALLLPIQQQEARVTNGLAPVRILGDRNPESAYQNALISYQVLLAETTTVEIQATQLAQRQADLAIGNFASALQLRQQENYPQVPQFQAQLTQAEQRYSQAETPTAYGQVQAFAANQTHALLLLKSVADQLAQLKRALDQMQAAGVNAALGQQEYQSDQTTFAKAITSDQLIALQRLLDAQLEQLVADQTSAIPSVGAAMLQSFQGLIDDAQKYGEDVTTFQQQHDQDASDLKKAQTLQQYLALSSRIRSQTDAMRFTLTRGKARYDLQTLKGLIGQLDYTTDYEYLNGDDAYGDEETRLQGASTLDDYQKIDDQLTILITNINAMIANLKDPNYDNHDQVHQIDLQLMQTYKLTQGKVMIVSLTEQTAREYENGQLVHWNYVVTGRVALPSPPGLWSIIFKEDHIKFKSNEPPNSPFWYPDTPINYAAEYHAGGFFFHDATWRSYFGPGANLPHDDYTSGSFSDDGTHGCINMRLSQAEWIYGWLEVGTPVIVF